MDDSSAHATGLWSLIHQLLHSWWWQDFPDDWNPGWENMATITVAIDRTKSTKQLHSAASEKQCFQRFLSTRSPANILHVKANLPLLFIHHRSYYSSDLKIPASGNEGWKRRDVHRECKPPPPMGSMRRASCVNPIWIIDAHACMWHHIYSPKD